MRIFHSSLNLRAFLHYYRLYPDKKLNVLKSFGILGKDMLEFCKDHRDKIDMLALDCGAWSYNNAKSSLYVDYLDLLQSDNPREHYRLELGEITSSLKTISGSLEIPIITATQLNREAYKRGKNGELGSDMLSESIQKLFIADFSVIMHREDAGKKKTDDQPEDNPKKVILKIDKNRDGKTGLTQIYFDYPRSRFMTQDEVFEAYAETLTV